MSRWISRAVAAGLVCCVGMAAYRRLMERGSTREERLTIHEGLLRSWPYRLVFRPLLRLGRGLFQHLFYPPALCANSDYPRRALEDIGPLHRRLFAAGFADNPALGRHLTGAVPSEQQDRIYAPAVWEAMKAGARVARFETASIHAGIGAAPRGGIDAFYLSNCPDYLRPPALTELSRLVRRAARPGARVFYLSLEPRSPFAAHAIEVPWRQDDSLARDLLASDTVGLYPFVGVGTVE
jgi:hypothetical protein